MPFTFTRLSLPEVILVEPRVFSDDRGFFMETFKQSDFQGYIDAPFVQENHSRSAAGVLRGLHYQLPPMAQGKLVRCATGAIWDVAIDIRKGSPTFKQWVGEELSAENNKMLFIPPGFAHGFYTLSETVDIIYKVSGAEYSPEHERGIVWNDPELDIDWPLVEGKVFCSERDIANPLLKDANLFD